MPDAPAPRARRAVRPLPALDGAPLTRWLCRAMVWRARSEVASIEGLEHVAPASDPVIVAANHSQRRETLWLAALLAWHRGGRFVRFLADWPMTLVPGVASLYARSGAILVGTKKPRVRALDRFRPTGAGATAFEAALAALRAGDSVGVYPEATMNRRRDRLLPGRRGAARLALAARVPVVPVGIRYAPGEGPIRDGEPMAISIGPPILPPPRDERPGIPDRAALEALHAEILGAIAARCGKAWSPRASRRRADVA